MKKGSKKGNEGFTLIQLMMALGIVFILASIAGFAYIGILDNARVTVCKTKLKTLNYAVEWYGHENEASLEILGELKLEHLEKAYAQVMESSSWYTKFSHAFLKMNLSDEVYAEFLTYENLKNFGAVKGSFRCPGDDNGGMSYGINANLAGTLWVNVGDDVVVVGDCDSATFTSATQLRKRHDSGKVAIAITKGGSLVQFGDDDDGSDTGGVDPTFEVDTDAVATNDDVDVAAASSDAQFIIDTLLGLGLAHGVETSLMAKLNNVIPNIESDDFASAIDKLELFCDKVEQDIGKGDISEAEGNELVDMTDSLIGMLGG
ncbi:MAG: hypothetical protein JRF24_10905 [Deltaproteobacteria bacterium]|nr:hypothetical protein [Deltaproteobacteria bacterium]